MAETGCLTVLYTANLAGKLDILPRMFSLIQRERQSVSGTVFLVDLGDTCVVESPLCRGTEGRGPFIVLDGMGYDVAIVGGPEKTPIPPSALRALGGRMVMPVVIWNRAREFTRRDVSFWLAPGAPKDLPNGARVIRVDRSVEGPGEVGALPVLFDVQQAVLGRMSIDVEDWCITSASHIRLTPDMQPDPVVGTLIDFVVEQARYIAPQERGSL